jgi:hypothetical protein
MEFRDTPYLRQVTIQGFCSRDEDKIIKAFSWINTANLQNKNRLIISTHSVMI